MAYYIQSKKKTEKKWVNHIPAKKSRETAEKTLARWKFYGTLMENREYRIYHNPNHRIGGGLSGT